MSCPRFAKSAAGRKKAPSRFELLLREEEDNERGVLEQPATDVPELNPFLAGVLERVKRIERERTR
jgi:hypothetical protein